MFHICLLVEKWYFLIEVGTTELELKLQCDFVQKKNTIGL